MAKGKGFSTQDLIDKGFVLEGGTFKRLNYSEKPAEPTVIKEKVNNSPDFEVKPATEWYVRGNVPSKKNSRQNFVRNGKQISIPSKNHAEYVQSTKMQYSVFGIEFKRTVENYKLQYPLRIEFTFVRGSKHSFDYCNACQTVEDIMKGHWMPDDSADYIIPVFKPYEYDKNNPGVKIRIVI
jgi:hypothetical protein